MEELRSLPFHSGEDRLVKKAFKEGLKAGIYSEINQDVIRPSAEECAKNGRAKSTKLRWAVKSTGVKVKLKMDHM